MKVFYKRLGVIMSVVVLAGCGGGGTTTTPPSESVVAKTYTTTITGINIVRSSDKQQLVVSGLPQKGATLTVK